MGIKESYKVPAIIRALDILEFIGRKQETSFGEIHNQLGIPKSTASQMLRTLQSRGYIRYGNQSKKYRLGFKLLELGNFAVSPLAIRAEGLPILKSLMSKTNQTCHLGILDGAEGVYLAKVEADQPIRLNSWEGKRIAPHSTALGKVMLAFSDEGQIDEILSKTSLTPYTERTTTNPDELRKHFHEIKQQGWVLDDQENEPDIRCVAAPVMDISGKVVAAISVSGLVTRIIDEVLPQISELVRQAARELSAGMGWKP